ncbi:3-hydroxyisobutyrate dehydrogenase [Caballeronia glathei]|uniref:Hydroxyacid oxidoreductase n=1 Tax=Caballeronia glathei TaxID=60547 RepID=A0A069PQR2_9BURK|nr:NAD(P)-dependent oxidoreductase [Caballeronia glathei]KDR42772.1 hydroxyacid oxidoreductase [Caballeronia glathei]CDY79008.1 3-hydroxyisobutyrate dehydrogenase [Caballeronia glathei]
MQSSQLPRIGFVGLGAMGWPMAACLLRAGFPLVPYDVRAAHREKFVETVGGGHAGSLATLGASCDIVINILPNSAVVESVLFGDDGIAEHLREGALVIDMTSGVPHATVGMAARLAKQRVHLFDAPVSGGVPRARSGELTIMAGGERSLIDDAMPILDAMGSVIRTGPLGSGHAMKALNNLVSAGGFLIGVEALLVGAKFGIDPETMVDILNVSSGVNNSTQKKFKQYVLTRGFDSGFSIELMVKDLVIALEIARQQGLNVPFASLCRDLWGGASALLGPGTDHTAVTLMSERLGGAEIRKH